jgi:hypothetical protein
MSKVNKEQRDKLFQLVKDAIAQDAELREKYKIGDKFRFVRDRLQALLQRLEENLKETQEDIKENVSRVAEDEIVVFVHLFNAQGLVLNTWQKMLNPAVFYEYSVNRPIYLEKAGVETFIRSKTNKTQHGYIAIAVKQIDVISLVAKEDLKDAFGSPIVRIKEGSLKFNKMVSFSHNGHEYELNKNGELIRKG